MSLYIHIFSTFLISISLLNSKSVLSQEINFGSDFSSVYSVSVAQLNIGETLDYGLIVQNQGVVSTTINESLVVTITGVKYLDVFITVTADDYLLKGGDIGCLTNPACRIPFSLEAAYANRGVNNANQAMNMAVAANVTSAQFPVKYRGNQPPGPPPTPVYTGFDPSIYNETAYLYLYGSISIGAIDAGTYTSDIDVVINYD